jgi:hypothetical protein
LAFVMLGTSEKFMGASGTRTTFAPLPTSDVAEAPYTLYAVTLTLMLSPSARLNGDVISVSRGTTH